MAAVDVAGTALGIGLGIGLDWPGTKFEAGLDNELGVEFETRLDTGTELAADATASFCPRAELETPSS